MKLIYHDGNNFGDALNPLVLGPLFAPLLDSDESVQLLGFGSILGLKRPAPGTRRRIVFTSGYAAGNERTYGPPPRVLACDDVVCVRGPLTAKLLGLSERVAVADGAILAANLLPIARRHGSCRPAFMPHVGSFWYFGDWRNLVADCGMDLIDPRDDPAKVIGSIANAEFVIAEAMHGAIVADALAVPWIPIRSYSSINEFKWADFCASMELRYEPESIDSILDDSCISAITNHRLRRLPHLARVAAGWAAALFHRHVVRRTVERQLRALTRARQIMSRREVLKARISRLLECAEGIKARYSRAGCR